MAAWHFSLTLVPEEGLQRVHGHLPDFLAEYAELTPDMDVNEIVCPNYWAGVDVFKLLGHFAERIFGPPSYCYDNERIYGTIYGNSMSIREEQVTVEFDLRYPDLEILEEILRLARRFKCRLVMGKSGSVNVANRDTILGHVFESSAFQFVKNPREAIDRLRRKFPEGDEESESVDDH